MSDYSALIAPDRAVVIKAGPGLGVVGRVYGWNDIMSKWEVDGGENSYFKSAEELEPMFTMDQVLDVKIADQEPGSELFEKLKPFGLSSEDLGEYVAEFMNDCIGRIKGTGNDQYGHGSYQKFEVMDLDDLFEYIEEEIRDIPNYCTMLFIRIRRLREALKAIDIIPEEEETISE